jgi:hypothetical protein
MAYRFSDFDKIVQLTGASCFFVSGEVTALQAPRFPTERSMSQNVGSSPFFNQLVVEDLPERAGPMQHAENNLHGSFARD